MKNITGFFTVIGLLCSISLAGDFYRAAVTAWGETLVQGSLIATTLLIGAIVSYKHARGAK